MIKANELRIGNLVCTEAIVQTFADGTQIEVMPKAIFTVDRYSWFQGFFVHSPLEYTK